MIGRLFIPHVRSSKASGKIHREPHIVGSWLRHSGPAIFEKKKENCILLQLNITFKMTSTVLVTGASGFLGRAVFNTFQHSGVLVVGQGFSRAAPPTILKADLEKDEDIQRLFDEVK